LAISAASRTLTIAGQKKCPRGIYLSLSPTERSCLRPRPGVRALGKEKEYQPPVLDCYAEVRTTVFKILKFYIMMLMVVWVAAMVSSMISAGMMMGKRMGMHNMKQKWHQKMGHMQEKACEEMEKEKEPSI